MVFCKAPVPGQVKTRLVPPLNGLEAAQLHGELTRLTLSTATQPHLCAVQLWCFPDASHPFFREISENFPVQLKVQEGRNLGERMHHAFNQALTQYRHAVLIGCDCPSLTNGLLQQAIAVLKQDGGCVIAPSEDGGYALIGLNEPSIELFTEMPWGTATVFEHTRNQLAAAGIKYKTLTTQWDVDTPADLARYRKQ